MRFTCEKSALHAAAVTAAKAASARSPIPALEGILLEANGERLRLTGYDLKKGIYTTTEAVVKEEGSIVLNARTFVDIVSHLPEGTVSVDTDGFNTFILCGSADYKITGSDPSDYPELPEVDGEAGVSLPQDLLSKMIRQTIFAVSDNEARPVYTGELFEIEDGYLTLVAVDGYRLALRREPVEGVEENCSFIVPGGALADLEKICGDTGEKVRISLGSKHISFSIGETVLVSRRLEGEFLNYKKTVPTAFAVSVTADRAALQRTLERVSLIIDDRLKNPLRCTFEENKIRIVCATARGEAKDACPVEGAGGGVEIGFNNRYLMDALRSCPAEEIKVCLNTGSSPCVIVPVEESDEFLYMILPVRLKAE